MAALDAAVAGAPAVDAAVAAAEAAAVADAAAATLSSRRLDPRSAA